MSAYVTVGGAVPFVLAESKNPRGAKGTKERKSAEQRGRQLSGEVGERIVTAALERCEREGLGHVCKRPTAFVVAENKGWAPGCGKPKFFRRYTGAAGADYSGHLRGGVAVYLECKHVAKGERLGFSALRESQHDELDAAVRDGAVAALVVVWGPAAQYLSVIGWDEAKAAMKGRDAGSFDLATYVLLPTVPLLRAYEIERQRGRR